MKVYIILKSGKILGVFKFFEDVEKALEKEENLDEIELERSDIK